MDSDDDAGSALDMPDSGLPLPDLPAGLRSLFPLPDAEGVCSDAQLRLGFAAPPELGTRGRVLVWDAASPAAPHASVDLGRSTVTRTVGDLTLTLPRPAHVDGSTAIFYLPPAALERGHTYYVTIEPGALTGPEGALVIDDATSWRFSVAAAEPARTATLEVALDGRAPFCSVQAALDAVPANGAGTVTIAIANGVYHEVLYAKSKRNLTLRGEDRARTVIAGENNENLNSGTKNRALVGFDGSSGLVIERLTIHNLTAQGGSQAEALRLQTCDQCIVRDADILSLQDTLLWSGRLYAEDCLIAGNVDFVWGTGSAYFDHCEIRTVGRSGYVVQARNGADGYGYVFVDSRITSEPGITGSVLARIDASQYPASHVAYIDCEIGPHISAAGWMVTGRASTALRFWEYGSHDAAGNPIDMSRRLGAARPLSAAEAAMMRDPAVVLDGFAP
jgi:pectin methylesterase-like acyl-CoA thioesterase